MPDTNLKFYIFSLFSVMWKLQHWRKTPKNQISFTQFSQAFEHNITTHYAR